MTKEDIKIIRMIAGNCSLPKNQRDELIRIADEQERYAWQECDGTLPDAPEDYLICVRRWSNIVDEWIDNDYKISYYEQNQERFWYDHVIEEKRPKIKAWKRIEPFKRGD